IPSSLKASQARISTSSQALYLFSSVQIAPISSRVYRSIIRLFAPQSQSLIFVILPCFHEQKLHVPFFAFLLPPLFHINGHMLPLMLAAWQTMVPYVHLVH